MGGTISESGCFEFKRRSREEELTFPTSHFTRHRGDIGWVVGRLTEVVAKPLFGEVSEKVTSFLVVETSDDGVGEDGLGEVVASSNCRGAHERSDYVVWILLLDK